MLWGCAEGSCEQPAEDVHGVHAAVSATAQPASASRDLRSGVYCTPHRTQPTAEDDAPQDDVSRADADLMQDCVVCNQTTSSFLHAAALLGRPAHFAKSAMHEHRLPRLSVDALCEACVAVCIGVLQRLRQQAGCQGGALPSPRPALRSFWMTPYVIVHLHKTKVHLVHVGEQPAAQQLLCLAWVAAHRVGCFS